MKEFGELMKRLQKMMPANVKPAFTTGEELQKKKKERLFTSLYDAIARTLMITNIRRNIPPTTKNFSLSVAPF